MDEISFSEMDHLTRYYILEATLDIMLYDCPGYNDLIHSYILDIQKIRSRSLRNVGVSNLELEILKFINEYKLD